MVAVCLSCSMSVSAQRRAPKGMRSDAMDVVKQMGVGWNLGNTLEAYNGRSAANLAPRRRTGSDGQGTLPMDGVGDTFPAGLETETSWGNPVTTKALIDSVRAAGFRSLRIPVRWYPHFVYDGQTLRIDPKWTARVKEIVGYALANDMYVVLNTHHEMWLESHPTYADSANVYKQLRMLWTEIAHEFADYDQHLVFAGTNEVHIPGNWGRPSQENADVQNGMNQVFVDAVRATGGKNRWRPLAVQTYVCNGQFGVELFRMPHDVVDKRLIVEVHNYDPYNYGLQDKVRFWGTPYIKYDTESDNDEAAIDATYRKLHDAFTAKGVPFIVGEMGANFHTGKDADELRVVEESYGYYLEHVVKVVRSNGGAPFVWDNGVTGRRGTECFGMFDRRSGGRLLHQQVRKVLFDN